VPFEFHPGEGVRSLGLTGRERYEIRFPNGALAPNSEAVVTARDEAGHEVRRFAVRCRIESETEMAYYRAGGLLPYVLGRLA